MSDLRPTLDEEHQRTDVSQVRNTPIRATRVSRRPGGRSGVSTRVASDVVNRLRDIRAVWFAVHNDPDKAVADVAAEFYFIVGEILEGRPLSALSLRKINRDRVNTHTEE
jgi:hypothetical protein